jgi:hypothetical protein
MKGVIVSPELPKPTMINGQSGGSMKERHGAIRVLLALASAAMQGLRRLLKRVADPGNGPFFAGT